MAYMQSAGLSTNAQSVIESTTGRKLIILGLGFGVSDADFLEYFNKFGLVEEAIIMRDSTGSSKGFGFVTFTTSESAAILLNEHATRGPLSIRGKRIDPKLAIPKGEVPPSTPPMPARTKRIFVGRLPATATKEELQTYFMRWGEVTDCFLPTKYGTFQPRGIAFITFASADSVDNVMQVAHEFAGRPVAVERAEPKKDDGPVGHGRASAHHGGYGQMGMADIATSHYDPSGQYAGWTLVPPGAVPPGTGIPLGPLTGGKGLGPMGTMRGPRASYRPYGR